MALSPATCVRQTISAQANLQALKTTFAPPEATNQQRLIAIGSQDQLGALCHQNTHLRLLSGDRCSGFRDQSEHYDGQHERCASEFSSSGEVQKHSRGQWSLSVPRPADCSQAFMAD